MSQSIVPILVVGGLAAVAVSSGIIGAKISKVTSPLGGLFGDEDEDPEVTEAKKDTDLAKESNKQKKQDAKEDRLEDRAETETFKDRKKDVRRGKKDLKLQRKEEILFLANQAPCKFKRTVAGRMTCAKKQRRRILDAEGTIDTGIEVIFNNPETEGGKIPDIVTPEEEENPPVIQSVSGAGDTVIVSVDENLTRREKKKKKRQMKKAEKKAEKAAKKAAKKAARG